MTDADTDPAPTLWNAIKEIQSVRRTDAVDRRKERRLKSAIAELDAVRIAIKWEASADD